MNTQPRRARRGSTSLLVLLLLAAVACVSERGEPVGLAADLDCTLPLDSSRIGNVGVVVIRNFRFEPAELRVPAGTRVTWLNCEGEATQNTAHTTTADGGRWSSPLLQPGQSFTTRIDASGSFEYHCEPHPSMRGRIVVTDP